MSENLNKKRENYISWEEYFMAIAKLSAMRSKDPSTQVGACIVSNDNRILSIGYNGAPNGFSDEEFPWAREGKNLDTKYPYVCHAEMNAILNYRGSKKDLENAKKHWEYILGAGEKYVKPFRSEADIIINGDTNLTYFSQILEYIHTITNNFEV